MLAMQIEVGKTYKTREGRKVSVIRKMAGQRNTRDFAKVSETSQFIISDNGKLDTYFADGSYIKASVEHPKDIVGVLT